MDMAGAVQSFHGISTPYSHHENILLARSSFASSSSSSASSSASSSFLSSSSSLKTSLLLKKPEVLGQSLFVKAPSLAHRNRSHEATVRAMVATTPEQVSQG
jgi:hypothetical protein